MVWTEPWFFCQRIRDRSDWIRALAPAVLAFVGITTLLLFFAVAKIQWWQAVLLGLGVASAVQFGIEAAYMRRDISLDDEDLEAFGNAGQVTSYYRYPLKDIIAIEIKRGEEIGFPFAMLVLRTNNSGGIVGIPKSISLERVATILHRLGAPVALSGWVPLEEGESEYIYTADEIAKFSSMTVIAIPEAEQNLTPLPNMLLAVVIAGWLLVVWLGLIIWGGVYLYQHRADYSIWTIICAAIAMFASLTIPFGYIEIVGDYWAANYLISVGKKRVKTRAAALITTFDETAFCVELLNRDQWAAGAPKVADFGFVRVDEHRSQILYEGNKERWFVPFSAVRLVKVEDVQYGTAGESATGQLRCYVVFEAQRESGPFEIGFRNAEKEIGKTTDSRRLRHAVDLFEYLTAALP